MDTSEGMSGIQLRGQTTSECIFKFPVKYVGDKSMAWDYSLHLCTDSAAASNRMVLSTF
jgi:hypothetical protein